MSFVHLHVHSCYSLLDGLAKPKDIVARAKEMGCPAIALTDHGVMYGAIEFYRQCKKNGIKPIIGMEGYIAPDKLHFKRPGKNDDSNFHITLLARTQEGYQNLMYLSSVAQIDGFYRRPRMDKELLREYGKGLICLSGCPGGELVKTILHAGVGAARAVALEYKSFFDDGCYFLEIMPPDVCAKDKEKGEEVNRMIRQLSQELGIPLVATADAHYLHAEDSATQDIAICIGTGKALADEKRMRLSDLNLSLRTPEEMHTVFADMPEAVENTLKVADLVELEIDLSTWHFPPYLKTPEGKTHEEHFRDLAYAGARNRYGADLSQEVIDRLEYEIDIILFKGYHVYFLVFADFMTWARQRGILTTARGSVAGSIVAYSLNITMVDPLLFQLPFERFLTKERPSAPDIDCDIQDSRRSEIIEYIRNEYGEYRFAQVCTFGTMAARAAVRDVARVMGYSYEIGDRIAKVIPEGAQGFPMTIGRAKKESPELARMYEMDLDARTIIDAAEKVEGNPRHVSVHAAGAIITPGQLNEFVPVQRDPKGGNAIITQYDMYALDPNVNPECVGVLKLDLLGLRNLNVLDLARKIIKKTKGESIDLYRLPLDDKPTFGLLAKGRTVGVFQLSGSGMTKYLMELEPSTIFDIVAMVALYRPGPLENIPEYIKYKHNPSLINYLVPELIPIIERSYGVLTYQDDVMMIAVKLAGYSWQDADKFRKAMGKKKPEEMAAQKDKFISGCVKNGIPQGKAESIFKLIEPFAAYGFNKSHAASYGFVAYQTAYLKAHYPAQFMTALLTAEEQHTDKLTEVMEECKQMGIAVLPPDVNSSLEHFTYISDTEIRFGLEAIRNLGTDISASIVWERKENGVFKDVSDFLVRCTSLNKKSLEALIKSGALDCFGERGQLLANLEDMLVFAKRARQGETRQVSLFAQFEAETVAPKLQLKHGSVVSKEDLLAWEKEFLGIFLSDHPFAKVHEVLSRHAVQPLNSLREDGQQLVAGSISRVKKITTKKGELMVFATIGDLTREIEVVVFPRVYEKTPELWIEGTTVLVHAKIELAGDEVKIIANAVRKFREETLGEDIAALNEKSESFRRRGNGNAPPPVVDEFGYEQRPVGARSRTKEITITFYQPTSEKQQAMKEIFAQHPGKHSVIFILHSRSGVHRIRSGITVFYSEEIVAKIEAVTGKGTVTVRE